MRKSQFVSILMATLVLVSCRGMTVSAFKVLNNPTCEATGVCEFSLELKMGNNTFSPATHYPTPSTDDTVTLGWGDGETYQASLPDCFAAGVCELVEGGFVFRHTYATSGGFNVSVNFGGETFENANATLLMSVATERTSTKFTTYNAGLAKGHVDYADQRKPRILEALNDIDTDVLCLQEMWTKEDTELFVDALSAKFPHSFYELTDSHPLMYNWGRNGLLILSRFPIKDTTHLQLDSYFINRIALAATIETENHGDVEILCTHLSTAISIPPYWGDFDSWEDEQNYQTQQILDWREFDVMIGDFNSSMETERISPYTPVPFNMVTEAGYFSPYAEQDPDCTWCVDNPIATPDDGDLVLDHLFFNPSYRNAVINVERIIDQEITVQDSWWNDQKTWLSDHAGITCELE